MNEALQPVGKIYRQTYDEFYERLRTYLETGNKFKCRENRIKEMFVEQTPSSHIVELAFENGQVELIMNDVLFKYLKKIYGISFDYFRLDQYAKMVYLMTIEN